MDIATPSRFRVCRAVFGLDLRSLAAFRIGVGLLLLWDIIDCFRDLRPLLTDDGALSRQAAYTLSGATPVLWRFFCLFSLSGHASAEAGLLACYTALALCFLLGLGTRWAAAACWFCIRSLQVRNPIILGGGHVILSILLFWSVFLTLDAHWALGGTGRRPKRGGELSCSCFTVAYLIQIAVIYWGCALAKVGPEWRHDYTAVCYALGSRQVNSDYAAWLLGVPGLCRGLSRLVLAYETIGPCLLFLPFRSGAWRLLGVVAFFAMHLGFGIFLRLGLFSHICCVALLPLVPGAFWDLVAPRSRDVTVPPPPPSRARARTTTGYAVQGVVGAAVVCLLLLGLASQSIAMTRRVPALRDRLLAQPWVQVLGFVRKWTMFAPSPPKRAVRLFIVGTTTGGQTVALDRDGKVSPGSPQIVVREWEHWGEFLAYISDRNFPPVLMNSYQAYLCRTFPLANAGLHSELLKIDVWLSVAVTGSDFMPRASAIRHVTTYSCPAPQNSASGPEAG
jgi:hypothetical protein